MNIIVAADKNWGIGRNNELLVQEKWLLWEEKHWSLFQTDFL